MSSAEPGRRAARVLCAGIAVFDFVFRLDRFPAPGEKRRAREMIPVGGGCAANAAVAVARLGGRARLAAPLGGPAGADPVGDRILDGLARSGVDTGGVVRCDGAPSPLSAILVDATGERMITNHRDDRLTALRVGDPDALVRDADAVLVDNRFADFVLPICTAARRRGLAVVLDGDRPAAPSDPLLAAATHIVFAADGLRATAGEHDLGRGLRRIAAATPAFLAVTDGVRGVHWLEAGTLRHRPAFAVEAVDTLAAGDVFHGAFALALAEGRGATAALRFAAAAAAIKCTRFGGGGGAPDRGDVEDFLSQRGDA